MGPRAKLSATTVGAAILVAATAIWIVPNPGRLDAVSGVVTDPTGRPVGGAIVRIQTTEWSTTTDEAGRFRLTGFTPAFSVHLTAWKDGFFVRGALVRSWTPSVDITLTPYPLVDNVDYEWIPPRVEGRSTIRDALLQGVLDAAATASMDHVFFAVADHFALGCRDCHGATINDQWAGGAHAQGVQNRRFMTMYNGTDMQGRKSPATRRVRTRDYGGLPLPPGRGRPYFGPGYRLDFPNSAGNCATCHLPGAALRAPYDTDPNGVDGVNRLGTHCDFCHKISGVLLDPSTGRPFANRPGILSLRFARPADGSQIFFGPFNDVDAGPDTYLPLMKRSEICAPCHDATFWGIPVYSSFGEWLQSEYSRRGVTCQHCHMASDSALANFAPDRGGRTRNPAKIPTHYFPGASDTTLLRNAVTMTLEANCEGDRTDVTVTIDNDRTGHHVPTDSPLRQMILLVTATDGEGRELPLVGGSTVPDWGGIGDPEAGYYAGRPGKGYAKILQELWTGVQPTGAYWNPTRIVRDNRLAAFAQDTNRFEFTAPEVGNVTVEARLLYRRAFIELMDQKGWGVPDILMERQVLSIEKE